MTFKLGDRVRETSTTTGTGSLTLAGAAIGFATFDSVLDTGDTTWYAIVLGADWEVGLGTFTSPGTLARTAVLASSSAGSAVSFAAGDKDVFITTPATAMKWLEGFTAAGKALTSAEDNVARRDALEISTANTPFEPTGSIVAASVQGAIEGLDNEKARLIGGNTFSSGEQAHADTAPIFIGIGAGGISGGFGTPKFQILGLAGSYDAALFAHNGPSGGYQVFYLVGVGQVGGITGNGSSGILYNTTSDYRLKLDAVDLIGSGEFINALRPRSWVWATDGQAGVGFIAHEAQAVSLSSVVGVKDAVTEGGEPIYQAMQPSSPEIMAHIVAEIQSLRARVAALEGVRSNELRNV